MFVEKTSIQSEQKTTQPSQVEQKARRTIAFAKQRYINKFKRLLIFLYFEKYYHYIYIQKYYILY